MVAQLPQEILELVFAYLSQSTLRCCARLVCKQWDKICRQRSLWRAATWKTNMGTKAQEKLQKQLRRLDFLDVWVLCDPGLSGFETNRHGPITTLSRKENLLLWNDFLSCILTQLKQFQLSVGGSRTAASSLGSQRKPTHAYHPFLYLKELQLNGFALDFGVYLEPLLPALTGLRKLKMMLRDRQTVKLLTLLKACPAIEELHVEGVQGQGVRMWVLEDEQSGSLSSSATTFGLKKLWLKEVSIQEPSLERLLDLCPLLRTIRLWYMNRPFLDDPSDFFCHYISVPGLLRRIAAQSLSRDAVYVANYDDIHYNDDNYRLVLSIFPELRTLTILNTWYIEGWILENITTLEIVSHYDLAGDSTRRAISEGLHRYLCGAHNLKHLIASSVYLDVSTMFLKATPDEQLPPWNQLCAYSWACQDLETLRIGLLVDSVPKSRADILLNLAYGYIGTYCPRVRTLELTVKSVSFGQAARTGVIQNNDGTDAHPLSQLAGLNELETLTLRANAIYGHIEYSDFEWIGTIPDRVSSDDDDYSASSGEYCLPRLESFQLHYRNSTNDEDYRYWMALMRELRPGLDVRAKQDLSIPSFDH
ncbi:hypothetical protein BG011_004277 [Mortierella polycephala]|uniref:F-box domain-containing protein n=1 Tax=Mortierella polycephala TaxID=41804 RepID=A0A9P6QGC7_9FUNG|nr:hypothetical protein BG011_004277 [Mortierella polycephala]